MDPSTAGILFASDLTVNMQAVFEQAASLAALKNESLVVLHVMEDSSRHEKQIRMAFGETLYEDLRDEQAQGARNILIGKNVDALRIKKAISGFFDPQEDNHQLSDDNALIKKILVSENSSIADEIVSTAAAEGCSIIVIGAKKQGLLAEAMEGNLVRKVLKRSSIPVLVVPYKEN